MAYSKSKTVAYSALQKLHDEFVGPSFEVSVAGTALSPDKYNIPQIDVIIPLTLGQKGRQPECGECSFDIVGMFDLAASSFKENLLSKIKVGKQIEVKGGYRNPPVLFTGVITSVDISYGKEGVVVSVTAMDAFSMMGDYKNAQTFNKKKPAQTVRDLLTPYTSGFPKKAKLGTIATLPETDVELVRTEMTDVEYLYFLARRFQKNLAIIHGEIIFDDLLSNKTPITTLTYGQNLISFRKQTDTSRQYGSVEVTGKDAQDKPITGVANSVSSRVGGAGKAPMDIDTSVKSRVLRLSDKIASTQADLKAVAQSILDESALGFVSGNGTCIGIPELTPGRYITVDGMDSSTNGTYFISRVTHSFGMDGYVCKFDIKGAKSK